MQPAAEHKLTGFGLNLLVDPRYAPETASLSLDQRIELLGSVKNSAARAAERAMNQKLDEFRDEQAISHGEAI